MFWRSGNRQKQPNDGRTSRESSSLDSDVSVRHANRVPVRGNPRDVGHLRPRVNIHRRPDSTTRKKLNVKRNRLGEERSPMLRMKSKSPARQQVGAKSSMFSLLSTTAKRRTNNNNNNTGGKNGSTRRRTGSPFVVSSPKSSPLRASTPRKAVHRVSTPKSHDSSPSKHQASMEIEEMDVDATQEPTASQIALVEQESIDDIMPTVTPEELESEEDGGSSTYHDDEEDSASEEVDLQEEEVKSHDEEAFTQETQEKLQDEDEEKEDEEEEEKDESSGRSPVESSEEYGGEEEEEKKENESAMSVLVERKSGRRKTKAMPTSDQSTSNGNGESTTTSIKRVVSRGSKSMTNRRRSTLRTNQSGYIDALKTDMGYGDVQMGVGVREALSESMNFFASSVLHTIQSFVLMKKKERLNRKDVLTAITAILPYSSLSTRIFNRAEEVMDRYEMYLESKLEDGAEKVRVQHACGLSISVSCLKNLAHQVIPTIGGLASNEVFVVLAAAVETVGRAILHRAVGAMISTAVKALNQGELEFRKNGTSTLTKDHLNRALHYMIKLDHVERYSTSTVYAHRRLDYEAALEKSLESSARRASNFRSKKNVLKKRVRERVDSHNERGLLTATESVMFLVHDNTIPLMFRNLKLTDVSTIPNIRSKAIPERMKRKYNTLVTGDSIIQPDRTMLKTMEAVWNSVSETEEAQRWYARNRE